MFIQAIRGRVDEGEKLRSQLEAWNRDVAPQAQGWLGTTAGVTDDGEFVAAVRFESEEAARRNSDRPEQGRWWSETERHFTGPVEFHDYPDAEPVMGGGSDDAGFVQVIQGRATDLDRLRLRQRQGDDRLKDFRPEIIGGTFGWDAQGNVIQAVYFTSEAEAREGERKMPEAPDEIRGLYEEYLDLVTDMRYFDLKSPWAWSPAGG